MAQGGTIPFSQGIAFPQEDRQFLSSLGYNPAAILGRGGAGVVFSGVCNTYAKKLVAVPPNEIHTTPGAHPHPVTKNYFREMSLNGRSCAIKLFRISQWSKVAYIEAQTLVELDHPNIVEIYLVCKSSTNVYIIMEYLNGGTLTKFLGDIFPEKDVDEPAAFQIIRQLTAGLQYLHSQNRVHNDLHSENIMCTVQNNQLIWKIVDFGYSEPLNKVTKNNMRDISNLGSHLLAVLRATDFERHDIEEKVKAVLNMMTNGVYRNMNEVMIQLAKHLPVDDRPPSQSSYSNRFVKWFSKK